MTYTYPVSTIPTYYNPIFLSYLPTSPISFPLEVGNFVFRNEALTSIVVPIASILEGFAMSFDSRMGLCVQLGFP